MFKVCYTKHANGNSEKSQYKFYYTVPGDNLTVNRNLGIINIVDWNYPYVQISTEQSQHRQYGFYDINWFCAHLLPPLIWNYILAYRDTNCLAL